MRFSVIIVLMILVIPAVVVIPASEPSSKTPSILNDLESVEQSPSGERARSRSQFETDDFGGYLFDDFDDNSDIEWARNCSLYDGKIRFEGTYPTNTWHYNQWSYRRKVEIFNYGNADIWGYQVNWTVPFMLGMQRDFDDIRFTYFNSGTGQERTIPHWIEQRGGGVEAKVWINVTKIPANGKASLFMYYGNPQAADASNGEGTFLFFDDFDGQNLNQSKWNTPVSDGLRVYSIDGGNLYLGIHNTNSVYTGCLQKSTIAFNNWIVETRQRAQKGGSHSGTDSAGGLGVRISDPDVTWLRYLGRSKKENSWLKYSKQNTFSDTIWKQGTWDGSDSGYHVLGMGKDNNDVSIFEDYQFKTKIADSGITAQKYRITIVNVVYGYTNNNGWGKLWTDWIRVRNQTDAEPTIHLMPYTGVVHSKPIALPQSMKWDTLSVEKIEPANTRINLTIINSATNVTINGHDNLTGSTIDLKDLNDIGIEGIRLQAWVSGNPGNVPSLDSWSVECSEENAWRDDFFGNGKIENRLEADEKTVGLWHFDDGSGDVLQDSSGNGNQGTIDGALWDDGRMGGAWILMELVIMSGLVRAT